MDNTQSAAHVDETIEEIVAMVTDPPHATVSTRKVEPEYMTEYRMRRAELDARIKGIRETALFRVKGDLYTKITPQDTDGDDVDNRYNLLVASLMASAIKTYAHHCMVMLAERNSGELEDWIECLKDLHPVRAAVEGACNGAFGRNYFG